MIEMSVRVCPKCKSPVGEHDHYFCSSCGEKLPKELARSPKSVKMRTYKNVPTEAKKLGSAVREIIKNRTVIYTLGLLIFIVIVMVSLLKTGIVELIVNKVSPNQEAVVTNLPSVVKKTKPEIVVEKNFITGTFGKYHFATLAPSETYYYFEGFDVNALSDYLANDEDLEPLFSKSEILLEDVFAGFYIVEEVVENEDNEDEGVSEVGEIGEEDETDETNEKRSGNDTGGESGAEEENEGTGVIEGMVYVFVPTDKDLVEILLKDIEDEKWLFELDEDYLIMVNNEQLFDIIDGVRSKKFVSLAQNTEFAKMRNGLDAEGKVQVFFMHEDSKDLVRNSLNGLDQSTITDINKVISSEFESVVIK